MTREIFVASYGDSEFFRFTYVLGAVSVRSTFIKVAILKIRLFCELVTLFQCFGFKYKILYEKDIKITLKMNRINTVYIGV